MSGKSALIVTDMLNDFVHGTLKCERAGKLVPVLQALIAGAREAGTPVIFSNDAHLPVDVEIGVWGEHAMAGTEGALVIPELAPQPGDYQIPGVHTHICVLHTAADAFFRGFKIAVVTDATDAFTEQDRVQGLAYIEKIYGAEMVRSEEVLAGWKEPAA